MAEKLKGRGTSTKLRELTTNMQSWTHNNEQGISKSPLHEDPSNSRQAKKAVVLPGDSYMGMRNAIVQKGLVYVVGIIFVILLSGGPAFGQLIVQPMRLDLTPSPGETLRTSFDLQNHDPNTNMVDLSLVDITQWEDGTWRIIEPDDKTFDRTTLSSCKDWISFDAGRVEVRPLRIVPINVTLKVPPRKRGFYAAGILASLTRPSGIPQVSVVVRFLVPVLVNIQQGRTLQHKVEMLDVGMKYAEPNGLNPATTKLSVNVINNGETFSNLVALGNVKGLSNGHWKTIQSQLMFRETGILPGATLKLEADIGRPLPSGKYKVMAGLFVDGRRTRAVRKELDFVGDPAIDKMSSQLALTITEPPDGMPSVEMTPGATRTTKLKLRNDSDDTINVETSLEIPPSLYGRTLGDGALVGDELDCSNWLRIKPDKFTLRRGGRITLGITAKMPASADTHAWYYSLLKMKAKYADGQNAGTKEVYICVGNREVDIVNAAQPLKLDIATMQGANNLIIAQFMNYGNSHYTPKCSATITRPSMGLPMGRLLLTSEQSRPMLPMESRGFSGAVDFSDYEPDIYYITAGMEYPPGQIIEKQIPIRVALQGNQKVVHAIQPERTGPVPIDLNR